MKYHCIPISLYIWFCNRSFCIGITSFTSGNHIPAGRSVFGQNVDGSSSTSSPSSSTYNNNNNNNNRSNGNSYRSINELNEYGSSPQINNARLASTLHGALTIVALSIPSNCIVVTSLERKLPGVIIQDDNIGSSGSSSSSSKIHVLAKEKSQKIQAIIGSGLQSDITFITSLLRKHISLCWERYDSIPSLEKITLDTTEIMTCFMGYDVNDEIRDGTRSILYNYNRNGSDDDEEEETISIGRPLACNLLLVEVTNGDGIGKQNEEQEGELQCRDYCDMKLVDPGGIVSQSLVGQAIGRGSKQANELLRQHWNDQLSIDELEEKCVQIIRRIVEDEGLFLTADGRELDDATIVCERLNTEGVKVKRLPFTALTKGP